VQFKNIAMGQLLNGLFFSYSKENIGLIIDELEKSNVRLAYSEAPDFDSFLRLPDNPDPVFILIDSATTRSEKEQFISYIKTLHRKSICLVTNITNGKIFVTAIKEENSDTLSELAQIPLLKVFEKFHPQIGGKNNRFEECIVKESEERFKLIFNESPIGIVVTTRDFELININPVALKMLGVHDKCLIIGKSLESCISMQLKEALFKGETIQFELDTDFDELVRKKSFPSENKGCVNFEITGHFIMIQEEMYELFYLQNITSRKEMELQMKLAQKKAEESDKLKSSFLANISHEIRTPLNSILGFSSLLGKEGLAPDVKKNYLQIVNKNGEQLLKIINEIIDISKIEAGVVQVSENEISVSDFFSDLEQMLNSPKFTKDKVVVSICKNNDLDTLKICSDSIRLKQIILNLIDNALKFTPEGNIEIGYSIEEKNNKPALQFYIKDTGIGIPEEKQKIIFERFRQGEEALTRSHGGNGLGLSLAKSYIELLGGKIWLKSTPGKGSAFFFTIPFKNIAPTIGPKPREQNKPYNFEGKSIMIVEDNESSYYYLEQILKETNATLIFAENGKIAVKICCGNQPIDLILMDIQMPELNGTEATIIIKKIRPNVPIIAQTANALLEYQENYKEAGFEDYITKPIGYSELLEKIAKYIDLG
jgi:PAS domain S-box-containing protein